MTNLPEYTDGCFELYRVSTDETRDFPKDILADQDMRICYREVAVFDRIRYELGQGSIEVTMKIQIPRYKDIDSKCICMIDGVMHQVYNAAHITDKNGFKETELTLMRPQKNVEVLPCQKKS